MLTVLINIRSTKELWLMEDDLWWKRTLGGRRPSVEDDFRWKTTLGGRRPLVEDTLWWKTIFSGRHPLVEEDLQWKTTFGGRRLLVEDYPCMLPSPFCCIFGLLLIFCAVLCSLEVAQIYFPCGVGGWFFSDYNVSLSSNWT